jgi:hypothetical protein
MVGATRRSTTALFAALAAGCLSAPPPAADRSPPTSVCIEDPGRPGEPPLAPWSIAILPGWSQGNDSADAIEESLVDSGVFNHVLHGAIAAGADGRVTYEGSDLVGQTQACAAVVAAHRQGYPIQIVLGGDRGDDALALATSDASRPVLVAGLLDFIDAHGYDGVSIAWIADIDVEQLSALVDDLAAAFALRSPRPLLTVDVWSGAIDPAISASWIARGVDAINLESYGLDWERELAVHLEAGVPPSAINLGIGLSALDDRRAEVRAKIDAAVASGLRGVQSWELGAIEDADDPRLLAYTPLLR